MDDGKNSSSSSSSSAVVPATGTSSRLYHFAEWYAGYHGYLSIVVCVVGVLSSIFVIAVLTRRHMINPTNYMLTALSVFDLLTMLSYVPLALQFYVLHGTRPSPRRNTVPWAYFCLFHANLSVTAHTVSIWLAVVLSAFRYVYVRRSRDGAVLTTNSSLQSVRIAIAVVIVTSVVVLLPNYACLTIVSFEEEGGGNHTLYEVGYSSSAASFSSSLNAVNFWIQAVVVKLLPCALMSVFGCLLLLTVRQIHRRGDALRNRATVAKDDEKCRRREKAHSRTTAMLVAVIVLFLATELPQGLLALCSGLRPVYFEAYYVPLGDVMDIVALINNGINFTLYCTMSQQFRKTFIGLIRKRPLDPVTLSTQ